MVALLALSLMNYAQATNVMADCSTGDAPPGWDTMDCDTPGEGDVCDYWWTSTPDGYITCDGTLLADGLGESVTMYAVYDYNGNGKFSMWGTSSGPVGVEKFCCVLEDVDDIMYMVELKGTAYGDNLYLNYDDGAENLSNNNSTEFQGRLSGNGGADHLYGSYTSNSYYWEMLLGGAGNDTMYGYLGNDTMQGNDGTDTMYGGYGNDVMCDDQDGDFFDAGHGNDTIYYGTASATPPDASSTANPFWVSGGADKCGDAWWGSDNPANCNIIMNYVPTECPAW